MPKRSSKRRPRDLNQLAKAIVDSATEDEKQPEIENGDTKETPAEDDGKNPAAVALGRLGGLKGGKARARKLSKKRRSEMRSEKSARVAIPNFLRELWIATRGAVAVARTLAG